jgi:TctA family transporter
MVRYHDNLARVFHTLPAALALGLPLLLTLAAGGGADERQRRSSHRRSKKAKEGGTGGGSNDAVAAAYWALAASTARTLCSILLSVGLPAILGACRALISGQW